MDLSPIANAAVTAAATAVTALAALALPMLPRLARWLLVTINGADVTLIRQAIDNAAETALQEIRKGQGVESAITNMMVYVEGNLPKTVRRVGVSPATLETMCRAALARLLAERGKG